MEAIDISAWRFILWDRADGPRPAIDEQGNIIASGAMGRVDAGNRVFVGAIWPKADRSAPSRLSDLEVGGCVYNVVFQSVGVRNTFDVYRVE